MTLQSNEHTYSEINAAGDSKFLGKTTQQAHNIKMTSSQRRCDVSTLHRRWYDVMLTLCAHWVASFGQLGLAGSPNIIVWKSRLGLSDHKHQKYMIFSKTLFSCFIEFIFNFFDSLSIFWYSEPWLQRQHLCPKVLLFGMNLLSYRILDE